MADFMDRSYFYLQHAMKKRRTVGGEARSKSEEATSTYTPLWSPFGRRVYSLGSQTAPSHSIHH
jgi:hypothetical protein